MPRNSPAVGKLPTAGQKMCLVCKHPAIDAVNRLILAGICIYNGSEFTTAEGLIGAINARHPTEEPIKAWNVTRHRPHVNKPALTDTQLVLRDDGKLYRRTPEGEMLEVPKFGAEQGLALIISVGLDQIIKGKARIGAKTVVEAIELLDKIQRNSVPTDEYDAMVAQRHRGENMPTDPLESIEVVTIPPDVLAGLRRAADDDETDGEDDG